MFKYSNGAGALNRYRYFRSLLNSLTCISRRNRWKESFAAVCFGGVQNLASSSFQFARQQRVAYHQRHRWRRRPLIFPLFLSRVRKRCKRTRGREKERKRKRSVPVSGLLAQKKRDEANTTPRVRKRKREKERDRKQGSCVELKVCLTASPNDLQRSSPDTRY